MPYWLEEKKKQNTHTYTKTPKFRHWEVVLKVKQTEEKGSHSLFKRAFNLAIYSGMFCIRNQILVYFRDEDDENIKSLLSKTYWLCH